MLRVPCICLLMLFISSGVWAIEASVSHSVFYLPDAAQQSKLVPSVDVYWQVNPRTVHYTTNSDKMIVGRLKADIYFSNETGTIKEDHFTVKTVPCASVEELMQRSIIDLHHYVVKPGLVRMKLVLTDLADSLHPYTFSDSFNVAEPTAAAFYSDVQLLDTVLPSPAATPFEKNGRQQVPACVNFLDDGKSILHYYAELYHADGISKTDYPLIQRVTVKRKLNDNTYMNLERNDTLHPQQFSIVSGEFPLGRLPSGNYYLSVTLENNARVILASSNLFFQRLNMHPIKDDSARKAAAAADTGIENINVLNLSKTFLEKYNTQQVKAILKMLLPVSDPLGVQTINGFLKNPDELYMRYYIYNYFQSINKGDPAKAWREYSDKVKEVNRQFSEHGTPGYETERGFIYLRYGQPTEIVTVENENGALPYEVWQYNTLTEMNRKAVADAVFLFYRPNQTIAGYKLLHSSVTGEIHNTSWRSFLYTNSEGGSSGNSRAEQIIGNK